MLFQREQPRAFGLFLMTRDVDDLPFEAVATSPCRSFESRQFTCLVFATKASRLPSSSTVSRIDCSSQIVDCVYVNISFLEILVPMVWVTQDDGRHHPWQAIFSRRGTAAHAIRLDTYRTIRLHHHCYTLYYRYYSAQSRRYCRYSTRISHLEL